MKKIMTPLLIIAGLTIPCTTQALPSLKTLAGIGMLAGAGYLIVKDTLFFKEQAQPRIDQAKKDLPTAAKSIKSFAQENPLALGLGAAGTVLLAPNKKVAVGLGLLGAGAVYYLSTQDDTPEETPQEQTA